MFQTYAFVAMLLLMCLETVVRLLIDSYSQQAMTIHNKNVSAHPLPSFLIRTLLGHKLT